jgi:5-methylcytosine-specific restriction endonuclease McrA
MNAFDDVYNDCPEGEPKIHFATRGRKNAAVRALRSSTDYQKARAQFRYRAQHRRNKDGTVGEPCWLCGDPIDYRLKFPHPCSWCLDHAIPIATNPNLALEPNNFRSAHFDCNDRRGTNAPCIDLGEPSEAW